MKKTFASVDDFISFLTIEYENSKQNLCLILSGTPGSGKSFITSKILEQVYGVTNPKKYGSYICSADNYFVDETTGVYTFDKNKLGQAHKECKIKFFNSICDVSPVVIVDNTNVTPFDCNFYYDLADIRNFKPFIVRVVPGTLKEAQARNVHNVPEHACEKMAKPFAEFVKGAPWWWNILTVENKA